MKNDHEIQEIDFSLRKSQVSQLNKISSSSVSLGDSKFSFLIDNSFKHEDEIENYRKNKALGYSTKIKNCKYKDHEINHLINLIFNHSCKEAKKISNLMDVYGKYFFESGIENLKLNYPVFNLEQANESVKNHFADSKIGEINDLSGKNIEVVENENDEEKIAFSIIKLSENHLPNQIESDFQNLDVSENKFKTSSKTQSIKKVINLKINENPTSLKKDNFSKIHFEKKSNFIKFKESTIQNDSEIQNQDFRYKTKLSQLNISEKKTFETQNSKYFYYLKTGNLKKKNLFTESFHFRDMNSAQSKSAIKSQSNTEANMNNSSLSRNICVFENNKTKSMTLKTGFNNLFKEITHVENLIDSKGINQKSTNFFKKYIQTILIKRNHTKKQGNSLVLPPINQTFKD